MTPTAVGIVEKSLPLLGIGVGALVLGFLIGAIAWRFLFRDVRIQFLRYTLWGVGHTLVGKRLAAFGFVAAEVVAIALVYAVWRTVEAALAAGGLAFGIYQLARRGSERREWFSQMAELGRVWQDDPNAFEHLRLQATYVIARDQRDRWIRVLRIRAQKPMILMKGVTVGATKGSGTVRGFRRMAVCAWADRGEVTPVPAAQREEEGLSHELALVLSQPMDENEDRELTVSGIWRDQWGPLRAHGHDEGGMTLGRPVRHLEIVVVFPRGVTREDCDMTRIGEMKEEGRLTWHQDRRGRVRATWQTAPAPLGEYQYAIDCAKLVRRHKHTE